MAFECKNNLLIAAVSSISTCVGRLLTHKCPKALRSSKVNSVKTLCAIKLTHLERAVQLYHFLLHIKQANIAVH